MRYIVARLSVCVMAIGIFTVGTAWADVLLDEVNMAGLPTVAAPVNYSFTLSTGEALTLTLTDLQTPADFSALQVAVTLGDSLVGSATVNSTTHVATVAIPSAAGTYTIFIAGAPDTAQGIGSYEVCVAPATNPTSCSVVNSSGNIQAPAAVSSTGTSNLNTNFTSTVAGTYTVTVTDDSFPVALSTATPISGGISLGATPIAALAQGTTLVPLAAATNYLLLLHATAGAAVSAGLYSVQITDPNGNAVFARTLPVGTLGSSTVLENPIAQGLNMTLTDYAYPAPLASVGVAVTQGANLLASLTAAPGSLTNFMVAKGSAEVWRYAAAGAQPGVYGVAIGPSGGASLYSTTQVVNPPSSTATSYAFVVNLPSAGTYNLSVSDFQFPAILKSLGPATVAQNGVVLTQTAGDFTAAAGSAIVVVDAQPPSSGNGIFSVTVQTSSASPQILLDQTQPVGGGVYKTESFNLGSSGGFTATLADLGFATGKGFPTIFQSLAVVVSQGGMVLGKIYGGGSFSFAATPGEYVLSFVATPDPSSGYGLYSIHVASTAPTVTFTSSAASVVAGGAVTLTWSSQNATTCSATGGTGWTGAQMTSGTLSVAVSATETLMLNCTGAGGSASQSLTLTATPAASKSGGGGGVDLAVLAMLAALWVASWMRTVFSYCSSP